MANKCTNCFVQLSASNYNVSALKHCFGKNQVSSSLTLMMKLSSSYSSHVTENEVDKNDKWRSNFNKKLFNTTFPQSSSNTLHIFFSNDHSTSSKRFQNTFTNDDLSRLIREMNENNFLTLSSKKSK